jgi:hypothetical protein
MPLYKFGAGDVFYNQIKAHPSSSFFVYNGKIYYNDKATEPGANVSNVGGVPTGHVSLYEMNVDRVAASTGRVIGGSSSISGENVDDTGLIYPFVYKGFDKVAFKTIKRRNFVHDYSNGDVITGSYQMSASIVRSFYDSGDGFFGSNLTGSAIKNSLDYAARLGQHYIFASGATDVVNLIDIPSIFYGSEIKKGSVVLDLYITGTLAARLTDKYYNGALVQESGTYASANDDQIAGVVLYNEGLILLTGSWALDATLQLEDRNYLGTDIVSNISWKHFALGANSFYSASVSNSSASYSLNFAGTHKIPTVTMLANANRGELNFTNNPTYIEYGQIPYHPTTGSNFYKEHPLNIKNIHSSSYTDPTGSLKKTTYITKIGIYDEDKKLIGIASVAKPVKKLEDRDLTFKLKLDM